MREQRRLRLAAIVLASLLVLGALPLYFGIRAATRDPVFTALDELGIPNWAVSQPVDDVTGSRWCLMECRLRERTTRSDRGPDETAQVYQRALTESGWQTWKEAPLCPEQPAEGQYSCWKRDELTLDLWVREPPCEAAAPPSGAPEEGEVEPSAAPSGSADCAGSLVTVKVRNAVDDERTRPQPSVDPSLTGEDPDPVLTDDPLSEPTPGRS